MSFKFGNDIFITFEMPGSSYILLQFRPSVIRDPWSIPESLVKILQTKLFWKPEIPQLSPLISGKEEEQSEKSEKSSKKQKKNRKLRYDQEVEVQ